MVFFSKKVTILWLSLLWYNNCVLTSKHNKINENESENLEHYLSCDNIIAQSDQNEIRDIKMQDFSANPFNPITNLKYLTPKQSLISNITFNNVINDDIHAPREVSIDFGDAISNDGENRDLGLSTSNMHFDANISNNDNRNLDVDIDAFSNHEDDCDLVVDTSSDGGYEKEIDNKNQKDGLNIPCIVIKRPWAEKETFSCRFKKNMFPLKKQINEIVEESHTQSDLQCFKEEIEDYFRLICSAMEEYFGDKSIEEEGVLNLLHIAKSIAQNFENFIQDDRWELLKYEIISPEVYNDLSLKYTTDEVKGKRFQKLKRSVLKNVLAYYGKRSIDLHHVDSCVQASVGLIFTFPTRKERRLLPWYEKFIPTRHCYMPYRLQALKRSGICYFRFVNPFAVFLNMGVILVQVGVPFIILIDYFFASNDSNTSFITNVFGEEWNLVHNKWCPNNLSKMGEALENHWDYFYVAFNKLASQVLINYVIFGEIRCMAKNEWNNAVANWKNHALPKWGIIASRIQNLTAYFGIINTLIVLQFLLPRLDQLILIFIGTIFLGKFDDEVQEKIPIPDGIGSSNDGGRKLYLSYMISGTRKNNLLRKMWDNKFIKFTFLAIFFIYVMLINYWNFQCV